MLTGLADPAVMFVMHHGSEKLRKELVGALRIYCSFYFLTLTNLLQAMEEVIMNVE